MTMDSQTTGDPAGSDPVVDEPMTSTLPQLGDLSDGQLIDELTLINAVLGFISQPDQSATIRESFQRIYTLAIHACKIHTEITRRALALHLEARGADEAPHDEETTTRCCLSCDDTMDIVQALSSGIDSGWCRAALGYLCPQCRATGHAPGYVAECAPGGEAFAIPHCRCGWVGPGQETLAQVTEAWRTHVAEIRAESDADMADQTAEI